MLAGPMNERERNGLVGEREQRRHEERNPDAHV